MNSHSNKIIEFLILSLTIIFYVLISLLWVDRPGLYYDELLFAEVAKGKFENLVYAITLDSLKIPVMIMPYIGALKSWIYSPIFKVLGSNAFSIRAPNILIGALIISISYLWTRINYSRKTALVYVLIIGSDPSFIFNIKLDWGPFVLMMFFKMIAIFSVTKYINSKNSRYIALLGFALGFGLFDKMNFAWFILSLMVCLMLFYRREFFESILRNTRDLVLFLLSFSISVALLAAYVINRKLDVTREPLISFMDLKDNFLYKTKLLFWTLSGNSTLQVINDHQFLKNCIIHQPDINFCYSLVRIFDFPFSLIPIAFVLCILYIALFNKSKKIVFVLTMIAIIFSQIVIFYRARGPHHILMLSPFPQLIIAHTLSNLENKNILKKIKNVFLVLLITSNFLTDIKYLKAYGMGTWSASIYELIKYLNLNSGKFYMLMDWGFRTQINTLGSSINAGEIFWNFIDSEEVSKIDQLYLLTLDPNILFIFHSNRYTVFDNPRILFNRMISDYKLNYETQIIYDPNHQPLYEIVRTYRDNSTNANLSEIRFTINAYFDNSIKLIGYNLLCSFSHCQIKNNKVKQIEVKPGEIVIVYLYFEPLNSVNKRYKIFLHLIGSSASPSTDTYIWAQRDQEPHNWLYPTTLWKPGYIVKDRYELRIPHNISVGEYLLTTGIYDVENLERLRVFGNNIDTLNDAVILLRIVVK